MTISALPRPMLLTGAAGLLALPLLSQRPTVGDANVHTAGKTTAATSAVGALAAQLLGHQGAARVLLATSLAAAGVATLATPDEFDGPLDIDTGEPARRIFTDEDYADGYSSEPGYDDFSDIDF